MWLFATKLDRGAVDDKNKVTKISHTFTMVQYNILIRQSVKHFFQPVNQCNFSLWNDYRPRNEMTIMRKWERSNQLGTQEQTDRGGWWWI